MGEKRRMRRSHLATVLSETVPALPYRDCPFTHTPSFLLSFLPGFLPPRLPLPPPRRYNAINGEPACTNEPLLNGKLRGEFGFKGVVATDCGALSVRAYGIKYLLKYSTRKYTYSVC